jgi:ElaB/YqjD/DUF883 family membrane-anchored ribosome-binding protein
MTTAAQNFRDTAKEAREGVREVGAAANEASGDIAKDLQALRDDLARLAEQVRDIVASKGNAAWRRAKSRVDDVVSDAQAKGQEAVGNVREVSDRLVDAIDDSISSQPYTVLAIAVGLGFLLGATWRR